MYLLLREIPVSFFLLASILIVIIVIAVRNRLSGLDKIPGPFLARYTDALRAFMAWRTGTDGEHIYIKLHNKYGKVVRIGPRSISVLDLEAIPLVYGVKARLDRGRSTEAFNVPGVPPSILGIRDGAKHARYRRPIQGAYSLTSLKSYEPYVNETLRTLLNVFDRYDQERDVINISLWVYYWSYDTVGKLTFGQPIGYLKNGTDFNGLIKRQRQFHQYVNVVSQMPSIHSVLINNPIIRMISRHTDPFITFTQNRVIDRIAKHDVADTARPDLLSHFIQLRESYPDVVNDYQVFVYVLTNVIAGSLSTSLVLDEIVKYLVGHPDSQRIIYEEITTARNGTPKVASEVSFDLAKKSPYLEGVVLEGLRLHHTGNLSSDREVSAAGLTLPTGYNLPPGTYVEVNQSVISRQADIFGANPEMFEPLRWAQKPEETTDAFLERRAKMDRATLTFGQGSRSCLGKNLVQLKVFKLIATLCEQYTLEGVGKPELYSVWTKIKLREKTS